jgi:hypothetical protein
MILIGFTAQEFPLMALLCIFLLIADIFLLINIIKYPPSYKEKSSKPIKYYLHIPDSPHVKNVHLELDYLSSDTAYLNWYSK